LQSAPAAAVVDRRRPVSFSGEGGSADQHCWSVDLNDGVSQKKITKAKTHSLRSFEGVRGRFVFFHASSLRNRGSN
jgi:hypothetical protein